MNIFSNLKNARKISNKYNDDIHSLAITVFTQEELLRAKDNLKNFIADKTFVSNSF